MLVTNKTKDKSMDNELMKHWNITQVTTTHTSEVSDNNRQGQQMAIKNTKYLTQLLNYNSQYFALCLYHFMLASCSPSNAPIHSLVTPLSNSKATKLVIHSVIHTNKLALRLQALHSVPHLLLAPPLSKVLNPAWQWISLPHSAYFVFSVLSTLCLSPATSHTAHSVADLFKRSTTTIHKSSRHQLWWR